MNQFKILFLASLTILFLSACSNTIAPHTAIKCKLNYDSCMIANTLEGPLGSHRICLAERLPACEALPVP